MRAKIALRAAPVDRQVVGPCWIWTASIVNGYGQFRYQGKMRRAHRLAYTLLVGDIPEGLEPDHLCRVRACVSPQHLEPVTHQENMRRGLEAQKPKCRQGHLLTGNNVRFYERKPGQGQRICRKCTVIRVRKYRAGKAARLAAAA